MTEIRFYDGRLNPLLQTDKIISLNITKNYRGYGNVEIHFPLDAGDVPEMVDQNKCLIVTAKGTTGVITGWRIAEDIALFGRTAEWLLTKRFLPPFTHTATSGETAGYIARQGISDFCDVTIEGDGETEYEFAFDNLTTVYDGIITALEKDNLGMSLDADPRTKRFSLKIYKGKDRETVLSLWGRTACNISATADRSEMSGGSGWYLREMQDMGKWSAASNNPKLYDNAKSNGFCYWKVSSDGTQFYIPFHQGQYIYSDTADGKLKVSDSIPEPNWDYIPPTQGIEGAERWDGVLEGTYSPEGAEEKLCGFDEKTDADALVTNVSYPEDYDLGDRVRVIAELGNYRRIITQTVTRVDIFADTDAQGTAPHLE